MCNEEKNAYSGIDIDIFQELAKSRLKYFVSLNKN